MLIRGSPLLFCSVPPVTIPPKIQSNSIIVESIIVEKSIIVDNLPSTDDFYLIKIQNSRNSKIVELFLGKVA